MVSYSIHLSLIYFTYHNVLQGQSWRLLQMANFFSLWLSNISIVCVCVCVWERESFRLHISVDGHLGFFHILAIANNVTMNIGVHIYFRISALVFFRYITRSGITRSYGSSILSFLRHLHTVFTVAAPIYIPINSVQGFFLLHILDNLLCSFWW